MDNAFGLNTLFLYIYNESEQILTYTISQTYAKLVTIWTLTLKASW
jgi:hypothetical protein